MTSESPPRDQDTDRGRQKEQRTAQGIIEIQGVSKSFGNVDVLNDISLSVRHGEIFGLIGPSGCGKSTLMELLVGQAEPTDGNAEVEGRSPTDFRTDDRQRIGYMPQGFVLYPSLTVQQNAKFVASLYGLGWRARRRHTRHVLELVDLWEVRGRRASDISGGMQRRLALACSLVHEPTLLFLDEPTAGLDPLLRNTVWEHLAEQRDSGVTVFVTTQNLEEAERCDRVGVMQSGELIAVGTPVELRERSLGGHAIDLTTPRIQRADVEALQAMPIVRHLRWLEWDRLRLTVHDAATAIPEVDALLRDREVEVDAISTYEPSFDEVFTTLLDGRDRS